MVVFRSYVSLPEDRCLISIPTNQQHNQSRRPSRPRACDIDVLASFDQICLELHWLGRPQRDGGVGMQVPRSNEGFGDGKMGSSPRKMRRFTVQAPVDAMSVGEHNPHENYSYIYHKP